MAQNGELLGLPTEDLINVVRAVEIAVHAKLDEQLTNSKRFMWLDRNSNRRRGRASQIKIVIIDSTCGDESEVRDLSKFIDGEMAGGV